MKRESVHARAVQTVNAHVYFLFYFFLFFFAFKC